MSTKSPQLVERQQPAKYQLLSLDHVLPAANQAIAPVHKLENEAAKQKTKPVFTPEFCREQLPKLEAALPNVERYARAAKAGQAKEYQTMKDLADEIKAQINMLRSKLG